MLLITSVIIRKRQPHQPNSSPILTLVTTNLQSEPIYKSQTSITIEQHGWNWDDLFSTNYDNYISNLRQINCPEHSITSLVIGDVNRAVRPHLRLLRSNFLETNSLNYWTATSKGVGRRSLSRWSDIESQINRDRVATIKQYIRTPLPTEALAPISLNLIDNVYDEEGLAFLPAVFQEEVRQRFSGLQDKLISLSKQGVGGQALLESSMTGQQEIYGELERQLSPSQLLELKARTSSLAARLREELAYMEPTEEEFKQIYTAFEEAQVESLDPLLADVTANAKINQILGDDRASQYNRSRSTIFNSIAQYCEQNTIDFDKGNQLYDLYLEAASTAGGPSDFVPTTLYSIRERAHALLQNNYDAFAQSPSGAWLNGNIRPDSSSVTYGIFPVTSNPFQKP